MGVIADKVKQAQLGDNPAVIAKMNSGWAVLGDTQPLAGYCMLIADPVVSDLNALVGDDRQAFLSDMAALGDAIQQVTGCVRINYEILGNLVPELHAHVIPRYADEPRETRTLPPMSGYDWAGSRQCDPTGSDRSLIEQIRRALDNPHE
ncbi:MAG: HIT family protein [Phycisphaerales bacterium]